MTSILISYNLESNKKYLAEEEINTCLQFLYCPTKPATSRNEPMTCCVGLIEGTRRVPLYRPGVWRGWRVTGNLSQEEWAQY